ncbi:hypothetical protein LTR36_003528 [Oleoguttula mirabilis]|uniref:cyclic pyranopterin monophosphate synthase n=1 Tax=Oleoguttula mirabilis TaxID=1507867 RepID=A0AAV9JJ95_9PEZI|nr:hypothetical protein LTR36_003528 [Oleoguttula mirabilis]
MTAENSDRGRTATRVPDPFAATPETTFRSIKVDEGESEQPPWGLSKEDMETVDSITDPSSSAEPVALLEPALNTQTSAEDQSRLTHVTASGEAHMVDVGAKAASRRVAIATAHVRFSNTEPFRLIFENNNKKGDVLGVARVAGIMAAKRTSDLIPLCHPVAISKVEVDVKLEAPGATSGLWANNKYGLVSIQAQVECVGPTGVEMEALTAVSGAALTVYDMCKAVDRSMFIGNTGVVYKSGGRSGLYCYFRWANQVGKEWFGERGLEVPNIPKLPGSRRSGAEGEVE